MQLAMRCKGGLACTLTWVGIPLTPDRGPNPHFLEKRVSGSKNSHFPSFWKREFSVKKSSFSYKGTHRKWGFLDRKLPFPAFVRARGNGGFGPRNPLFQEMGIRAPVWGRGNPNTWRLRRLKVLQKHAGTKSSKTIMCVTSGKNRESFCGADLRGSPGTSGEVWGTSGEVWETSGEPLVAGRFHSERTSGEVAEKLPGKFGARGSLTPSQRLAKIVSKVTATCIISGGNVRTFFEWRKKPCTQL